MYNLYVSQTFSENSVVFVNSSLAYFITLYAILTFIFGEFDIIVNKA